MAAGKLEFVRDGFGTLKCFTVSALAEKYKTIYLSPEVTRKVDVSRYECAVKESGMYYLRKGDIVLR